MARGFAIAGLCGALCAACSGSSSGPAAPLAAAAPEAGVQNAATANPAAGASGSSASTLDAGPRKAVSDAASAPRKHWPSCDGGVAEDNDAGDSPYTDACLVDEQHGVFVDAARGDDDNSDGSRDYPFKTLGAAVRLAVNQHKHVYACAGVYEERMLIGTELTNGFEIYGSFSCATFLADPNAGRSLVRAKGKGAALQISNTHSVKVEGFDFENIASDSARGTSYVGAAIENAQKILLTDVGLHAASGEPGNDGAAADAASQKALPGTDGAAACAAASNPGGAGGVTPSCVDQAQSTSGGSGGGGGVGTGSGGTGVGLFGSSGGIGEIGASWSCTPGVGLGQMPPQGYPGGMGAGAGGFGALISGGFVGFSGQPGSQGNSGYGGPGGGGALAPASCPGLSSGSGASGGGGGAGGCGGAGGKAGSPGGSSFGLIAIDSDIRFEGGHISVGDGGQGGRGADGQLGGKGAPGGHGGSGVSGSKAACDGVAGTDGGPGGAGGGGNGGHAIGALYVGHAPRLISVSGEAELARNHGGAAGLAPAAVTDPMQITMLTGTPGVVAFAYPL